MLDDAGEEARSGNQHKRGFQEAGSSFLQVIAMSSTQSAEAQQSNDIAHLLMVQNDLLRKQIKAYNLERKQLMLSHKELIFSQRQMLPEESRPDWVCADEAAYLIGLELRPSLYHRRLINWLHKHGELITSRGQRAKSFLRTEVLVVNKRLIEGELTLPSTA